MRFSTTIEDQGSVENFARYFTTIARICRAKVGMKIADEFIEVHSTETIKNGGSTLVLKFPIVVFNNYAFLPTSDDLPFILMELEIKKLAEVLASAHGHTRIKLFNKRTNTGSKKPHLLVEMRETHCVHHIPVTIVSEKRWASYERSRYPEPTHSVNMPSVRQVLRTLQAFRSTRANFVTLECKTDGRLSISAQMDQCKTTVHFPESILDNSTSTEVSSFRCKLNLRALLTFFSAVGYLNQFCPRLNVISERTAQIGIVLDENEANSEINFTVGTVVVE